MANTDEWLPRPKQPCGDSSPYPIFCSVGLALTLWETIEGEISIAYIGLIDAKQDRMNRYFMIASFEKRHALVKSAITTNVNDKDCGGFSEFLDTVLKYSPRRHEIAHGRVFNLGEYGFYLGPNNTLSRNYPDNTASYQYTSDDVNFFCDQFDRLAEVAKRFAERLARRKES